MARNIKVHINSDRSINDLDTLIEQIKSFNDMNELKDMLNSLEKHIVVDSSYIKEDEYRLLKGTIERRIKLLSFGITGDVEDVSGMNYMDFTSLITSLIQGKTLKGEEQFKLVAYANNAIVGMKDENISPDEQNAIDTYVDLLRQKGDIGDNLSIEEKQVISSYDHTVEKIRQAKIELEKNKNPNVLKLEPIRDTKLKDHGGHILTITVLEVTLLLGLLIAVLIIALT